MHDLCERISRLFARMPLVVETVDSSQPVISSQPVSATPLKIVTFQEDLETTRGMMQVSRMSWNKVQGCDELENVMVLCITEYILGRDEIEGVYPPSQQERTLQLRT
jgi:hypothetical protein